MAVIPEMVTDVDCVSLASAFDSGGDNVRAQKFYEMAIEKSPTNILRMWNLRAIARFWFSQGNASRGRKTYEEALQLQSGDNDAARHSVADTYLLWSNLEDDHGYRQEAVRVRELGRNAAARIGNQRLREDMLSQLRVEIEPTVPPV